MSINYIITSPAVINGTGTSQCSLDIGGDSINIQTPSGLSNTYNFVLPPDIGIQDQVLTLNSSLETEYTNGGIILSESVSDTNVYSNTNTTYLLIPSMTLTPPAGTYYCNFSTYTDGAVDCAIFVDGTIVSESIRTGTGPVETLSTLAVVTVNGSQNIEVRSEMIGGSSYNISERVLVVNLLS